jgi:hypothetical protein
MKLQQQHKQVVTRNRNQREYLLAAVVPVRPNKGLRDPWTCPRTSDYSVMSLFHDLFPKDGVSDGTAEGSRLGMAFNISVGGLSRQGRFAWGGPNHNTKVNKNLLEAATAKGEHFHMSLSNTSALKTAIAMDKEIEDAVRKKRALDSAPKLPVVLLGFERADGEKKDESGLSEIGGPTLLPDLPTTDLADFKQLGNAATQLLNNNSLYDLGFSDEVEGGIRVRLAGKTCNHDVPQALSAMAPGFSVYQEEFVLPPGFDLLVDENGEDIPFDVGTVLKKGQLIGFAGEGGPEVRAEASGTIADIDASGEANVIVRQGQYADWKQIADNLTAEEIDFVLEAAWARAWQGGTKEYGKKKGSEYWPETIRWIDMRLINSELLKPSTEIGDDLMSVMSMEKGRKEFRLLTDFSELLNPGGRMPIQVVEMMQANPTSLKFEDPSGKTSLDLHSVPPSRLPYRNVAVARARGEQARKTVSENLQDAAKKNPTGLFGGLASTPTASS